MGWFTSLRTLSPFMALKMQKMFARYLIDFSDWTSHGSACGDQLKIKERYKGICQEASTLLLLNFLTEMNHGSNILSQAVRAAEVVKSKTHRKLSWCLVQGVFSGAHELLSPRSIQAWGLKFAPTLNTVLLLGCVTLGIFLHLSRPCPHLSDGIIIVPT